MPDILGERADALALGTRRQNRLDTIEFYRSLAAMDQRPIGKPLLKYEESDESVGNAEALLRKKLGDLKSGALKMPPGRFSAAMFLLDRLGKLRQAVRKADKTGLFSLYLSLREQVCLVISENYFKAEEAAALDDWISIEPLVAALSELCGMSMPQMDEIAAAYKP